MTTPEYTRHARMFASAIDVRVLNEFANVARRKLGFSWDQLTEGLDAIRTLCRAIHPLDVDTHVEALRLAHGPLLGGPAS